jgi:hypothetical protein
MRYILKWEMGIPPPVAPSERSQGAFLHAASISVVTFLGTGIVTVAGRSAGLALPFAALAYVLTERRSNRVG